MLREEAVSWQLFYAFADMQLWVMKSIGDEKGGACGTFGEEINSCRVVVGQHDRMRPLGRTGPRWANIKMDTKLFLPTNALLIKA